MEALRAQWASEAVLFSISERPAQKAFGIWRDGN
jgi:gentisate 1,2-dioxygenase